jgi:hypothetical protein
VGSKKNQTFEPKYKHCKECITRPIFPADLQTITAAKKADAKTPPTKGVQFRDWVFEYDQKTSYQAAKELQRRDTVGSKI